MKHPVRWVIYLPLILLAGIIGLLVPFYFGIVSSFQFTCVIIVFTVAIFLVAFYLTYSRHVKTLAQERKWHQEADRRRLAQDQTHQAIIESVPLAVFVKDQNFRYISFNSQYAKFNKLEDYQIMGKTDFEIFPLFYAQSYRKEDEAVLKDLKVLEIISQSNLETGPQWIKITKRPLVNFYGGSTGILGTIEDVTESYAAEKKLKENEALFRATFAQATVGMVYTSLEGIFLEVNSKFCDIVGYSSKELLGQLSFRDITHPLDVALGLFFGTHGRLTAGQENAIEKRYLRKDGKTIWVSVTTSIIHSQTTAPRLLGVIEDITAQKEAQKLLSDYQKILENQVDSRTKELQASQQRAQALFKAVPVPTFIWQYRENDFWLTDYNAAAFSLTKGEVINYLGKSQNDFFNDQNDFSEKLEMIVQNKIIISEVIDHIMVTTGEHLTLSIKGAFVPPDQVILHMEDITALRRAEIAQREARSQAEAAAKAKSQFLANISHEIRTPLNAILGLTAMLQDTSLTENQKDYLEKVRSGGQLLLGLLNDVLDYSKIEAGKIELEHIPFDIRQTFQSCLGLIEPQAKQKGLSFQVSLGGRLPQFGIGDPMRYQQILLNILGNALKFTSQGYIKVLIDSIEETEKDFQLLLTVEDTGIGITQEQQERLFKPFSQADGSTSRKYGGTGLGLVITKSLVDIMGGTLSLMSTPEKGSRFTLQLPVIKTETAPSPVPQNASKTWQDKKILLTEDNKVNQMVAMAILQKKDLKVEIAENGPQALLMLKQEKYDVLLLDIQMPGMDGYEVTRKIREELLMGKLPIIAMTAHAAQEDKIKCLEAGMNGYVSKPIQPEVLWKVLEPWLIGPDESKEF